MIRTAIVLAGGFGTRLREVVQDVPKPMALVAEKPFLTYILNSLDKQGIRQVVLSVGYKAEIIQNHFGEKYKNLSLVYCLEDEPLGTGGGMKKASELIDADVFFALNGDTFFDVDLRILAQQQAKIKAIGVLALKPMQNFDRYGTVQLNKNGFLEGFKEKQWLAKGLINGGVYCLNKRVFDGIDTPKFSFETEVLEKQVQKLSACVFDTYFIDIGIPEDYAQAQKDFQLKRKPFKT